MTPFERIEKMIVEDEGGWVFTNRADDAGGPTYGGMTWKTFDGWQQEVRVTKWGREAFISEAQDRSDTLKDAICLCYHDVFWTKGHCAEVPEFAQQMYLSHIVNTNLKEGLKCLQMAFNTQQEIHIATPLKVDGHWGPATKHALQYYQSKCEEAEQYKHLLWDAFKLAFSDAAMHRYIRIAQQNARAWREYADDLRTANPTYLSKIKAPKVLQSENLMGWFNRARRYRNM